MDDIKPAYRKPQRLLTVGASFASAFLALLPFRIASALLNPVGDCDETFNYWEPTHYIMYGSGFQTWEYSPEYSLRSYIYILWHAGMGHVARLIGVDLIFGKIGIFFFIRIILGTISSACEAAFVVSVYRRFSHLTALLTLVFLGLAPGMFNAGSAYLPQSFTMCALLLSFSAWMRQHDGTAIFFMGVASLIGWPFSVLIGIPMGLDILLRRGVLRTAAWGVSSATVCIAIPVAVDYLYYRKFVFAALNIALYNSSSTHGANLYGIEPWTYYMINLFLNFNVAFFFSLLALVYATLLFAFTYKQPDPRTARAYNMLRYTAGFYIWLGIMLRMPHKEERFLFVVYPLLCLAAAYFIAEFYDTMEEFARHEEKAAARGGSKTGVTAKKARQKRQLNTLFVAIVVGVFGALSVLRIAAMIHNFSAPFTVYQRLYDVEKARIVKEAVKLSASPASSAIAAGISTKNVCVGKEWYRFPSNFFLQTPYTQMQYLKADFSGLLPKPFEPLPNGTWTIPSAMNDMNRQELSRYVDVSACDYIVDLELQQQNEPRYGQLADWEVLYEERFLDSSQSPTLTRAFFFPNISPKHNRYGVYQLLRRTEPVKNGGASVRA